MPRVSVVVPNYNHARFLAERLDSILGQTYRDFELIVLDDASTDSSREVLRTYAGKTPMQLMLNERNSGSTFHQWRRGAERAQGEFLWIAESDDFAAPRLLERLVAVLEQHPSVGLAYCRSLRVSADGALGDFVEQGNAHLHPTRWLQDHQNDGRDEVRRYFFIQNVVANASAALTRRAAFLQALEGAEERRLTGDWYTWTRILRHADIAFVAEPLNHFRTHGRSVRETTRAVAASAERFSLQAALRRDFDPPRAARAKGFAESYGPWRHHVRGPNFQWQREPLLPLLRDAYALHAPGMLRMLLCLAIRRMSGPLPPAVRAL